MTFDWFLLLTPILLLPLLLLLSFTGCNPGTVEINPSSTFILHDSSLVPVPVVTKVEFRWTREEDGDVIVVYVEEFELIPGNPGEQIREFRYQPTGAEFGQVGKVTCRPFELALPPGEHSVTFEIIPDIQFGGRVQVSQGGCPGPTSFL